MVYKTKSTNEIIETLLKHETKYEEIGKLFLSGLINKKRDILAFTQEEIETHRIQHIQTETMKRLKLYLQTTQPEEANPYIPQKTQPNSLTNIITNIITEQGEKKYKEIGEAIHQGTKNYLKKNPLARNSNYHQYKEYNFIRTELQKLL